MRELDHLSSEEAREVMAFLASRGIRACPMCSHEGWLVDPNLLVLHPMSAFSGVILDGIAGVFVRITCEHCQFSALFQAKHVGVDHPPPARPPALPDEGSTPGGEG